MKTETEVRDCLEYIRHHRNKGVYDPISNTKSTLDYGLFKLTLGKPSKYLETKSSIAILKWVLEQSK